MRLYITRHEGNVNYPAAEIESMMPFPINEIRAWMNSKPDDFSSTFRMFQQAE